jgi:predicted transglutaminase-like cysteine proteinase
MFSRVAACGVAVFLLVSQASSSGESKAFADMDALDTSAAIAIAPDQSQDQISAHSPDLQDRIQNQILDQVQNPVEDDAQTPVKMAALDPTERSSKSPAVAGPAVHAPDLTEPFGLTTVPVASGAILTKWSGVEADLRAENEVLARCREGAEPCPAAARSFLAIVAQGRAQTGLARIGIINRAINLAIRPMSDLAQWGVIDRWSAPLETLTTGRGDCEDYAIAKYVALTQAGVDADDVRLVIVRDLTAGGEHAVVAARLESNWIILDNRWLMLVEDSKLREMVPLFVLDQVGVRQFAPTTTSAERLVWASSEGAMPVPSLH